jgi:hypothetical protein
MKYPDWKKIFVDGKGDKTLLDEWEKSKIKDKTEPESDNWAGLNYTQNYDKKLAIDRLKTEYGIQFNDSRKYPMNGELLSDCVGWLDSFAGQYPGFIQNNPCKIPEINNQPPSKMKNAIGYYSFYPSNTKVVELALNGQYHSDVKTFQDYVDKSVKSKWYPENATIHKTFIHEFGHSVANSMKWISQNPNWQNDFLKECIAEFNKVEPEHDGITTYVGMGDYVSRYAETKYEELFAEAFAEYFGGENPREFAKIFGKKLDAILKGVK